MTRLILAAVALACLAGCAAPSGPPSPIIQRSYVPIAVPCSVDPGQEPVFADSTEAIIAAPNVLERAKIYAAGRQQRIAWEAHLAAVAAGCKMPHP